MQAAAAPYHPHVTVNNSVYENVVIPEFSLKEVCFSTGLFHLQCSAY